MTRQSKIQKTFIDCGFGFPVKLTNVPMIKIRDSWTPDIDYARLAKGVLLALSKKLVRLTGNEVRFIRQHFEMTLENFAKRFAVSHPAVIKWERAGDEPTSMNWSTEKDLRLFILFKLNSNPKELSDLYLELEMARSDRKKIIQLNGEDLAA